MYAGENINSYTISVLTQQKQYALLPQGEEGGDSGDDEEEEDGFFVPHGYLSDSEGDHSGDEGAQGQDNQVQQ